MKAHIHADGSEEFGPRTGWGNKTFDQIQDDIVTALKSLKWENHQQYPLVSDAERKMILDQRFADQGPPDGIERRQRGQN